MATSFEVSPGREMVSKDRAIEILETLQEGVESLSLSGKSYGTDAAEHMSKAFKEKGVHDSVRVLNLADVIAGRPEDEAHTALSQFCEVFSASSGLESIDLSDNALGSKGVKACTSLLVNNRQLKHIYFRNNGLNNEAVKSIADLLLGDESQLELKTMEFSNNLLMSEGGMEVATIIEKSPMLEKFVMTSTRVGREGAVAVSKALQLATNLRHLEVSDNTFGEEGAEALVELLRGAKSLEVAILRDLSIDEDRMKQVVEALTEAAPQLKVLDLSTNELGSEVLSQIAKCLKAKPGLEMFALEEAELGSSGAQVIAEVFGEGNHTNLKHVGLTENQIGRSGALALVQSLSGLPALSKLDLDSNQIPEEIVESLKETLGDLVGDMDLNDPDGDADEEDDGDADEEDDGDADEEDDGDADEEDDGDEDGEDDGDEDGEDDGDEDEDDEDVEQG